MMRDEADRAPAKVIFTFDGDAAGQKAAMRAFADDQKWSSQSFVAVEKSGKDPCELRQAGGDPAVQALIEDAVPMFEFAVRTTIKRFDLATAEGRIQAVRAVAPIVASIRDQSLQPEYTREVSGMLGLEVEQVASEVSRAGRLKVEPDRKPERPPDRMAEESLEPGEGELRDAMPVPNPRDPVVQAERQLLQVLLQFPTVFTAASFDALAPESFSAPAHRAVFDGIRIARHDAQQGTDHATVRAWTSSVIEAAPSAVAGLVSELAVGTLPIRMDPLTGLPTSRSLQLIVDRVRTIALTRRIADAMSEMRRLDHAETPAPERARELSASLQVLQRELATIKVAMG